MLNNGDNEDGVGSNKAKAHANVGVMKTTKTMKSNTDHDRGFGSSANKSNAGNNGGFGSSANKSNADNDGRSGSGLTNHLVVGLHR